jgi:predicted transcriptional regulator
MALMVGELERAVMEQLWQNGPASVKGVHRALGDRRGIKPNTVQSTMDRLFRKGLLRREKVSHAFVYQPAVSREELSTQIIGEVLDTLAGGETGVMLNAFVNLAEREGDDVLAKLEELITHKRRQTPSDGGQS